THTYQTVSGFPEAVFLLPFFLGLRRFSSLQIRSPDLPRCHYVDLHLGVFSGVMPPHRREYPQWLSKELEVWIGAEIRTLVDFR
ncbi:MULTISPECIES: hypothetical protein, partial [unclassified Sphingomonas]|uniref:hypothetical protein n=1 Tax=unclassified Sphingomonas TaxID=196159 RepID=UPI00226A5823